MSNINDYDEDFQDHRFDLSWFDLAIIGLLIIVVGAWLWVCSVFKRIKKYFIKERKWWTKDVKEYEDWINQN